MNIRRDNNEQEDYRPSDFMRGRRPEQFSDSQHTTDTVLTQDILEYYLDTVTKRKQETEFEHFSRRLLEKEICPNLLPQTGPTGGGDSKVDTETYPVADSISLRWYEGIGRDASMERWAFAISAKEDWRSKVKSDVAKIVSTGRDYKHIYFVSSRFIKDKDRAAVEDQLTTDFNGVKVHILDRSWIVKCILEHDRAHLAIEGLNIQSLQSVERKITGPRDLQRSNELAELEKQIEDQNRYSGVEYQLVEDCLQSAILARGLELPRTEVEGRFERARRIADRVGYTQQKLRVVYARAWTAFWWYDDFNELNRLYSEVESLAFGSSQANDLERVFNLWTCLNISVNRRDLDDATAQLSARTASLMAELNRLEVDVSRPNNALMARTSRLLIELHQSKLERPLLDPILIELTEVVRESYGLVDYPFDSTASIIRELGNVVVDSDAYDSLLESIVEATVERGSEGNAGRILLERGWQQVGGGHIYDSIRTFGRALQKLARHEDRHDCISALGACGVVYRKVGLLWASRASFLAAANMTLQEFHEDGEMHPVLLRHVQTLTEIEMQLGRVTYALAWIELAVPIAHLVCLDDIRQGEYEEQRLMHDQMFGALLLGADTSCLTGLDRFPAMLEEMRLDYAWVALLYALGYEDVLREQGALPSSKDENDVSQIFQEWVKAYGSFEFPSRIEVFETAEIILRSVVLGCEISVRMPNDDNSVAIAEMVLSALEAFMATSIDICAPHVSSYEISITPVNGHHGPPSHSFDSAESSRRVKVAHAVDIGILSRDERADYRDWLVGFIIDLSARLMFISDLDLFKKRVLDEERAIGRAVIFSETYIALSNIFGEKPKFRIADWEIATESHLFPLIRAEHWDQANGSGRTEKVGLFDTTKPGVGRPPSELSIANIRHSDRRVFSIIDIDLWNKAQWIGVGFGVDISNMLCFYVIFKDKPAAESIFANFRRQLGESDDRNLMRISVIQGIDREYPHNYRVLIGSNPQVPEGASQAMAMFLVARLNTMTPPDSSNLNRFIKEFEKRRRYRVIPAVFYSTMNEVVPLDDVWIEKTTIRFVPAWQLGENDPDIIALHRDEEPIIPQGVLDAPVMTVLHRMRAKL